MKKPPMRMGGQGGYMKKVFLLRVAFRQDGELVEMFFPPNEWREKLKEIRPALPGPDGFPYSDVPYRAHESK